MKANEKEVAPIQSYADAIQDEVITKANCKLCNSSLRSEAEAKYEQTKNYAAVHKFLEEKNEKIQYLRVRNHLVNHYLKQQRAVAIKELAGDLQIWAEQRKDRKTALLERIDLLNNEMLIISAETEGKDLDERRKSADALKKLADTIFALEEKVEDMEREMEPVFAIIDKMRAIISDKIKKTNNQEVKAELMSLFDHLASATKDIEIPVKD